MLEAMTILGSALAGAVTFRLRGGWFGSWPADRQVTIGVWSALLTGPLWMLAPWYYAAGAFALTFAGTSTGHGSGIDFGRHPDDDPDELWRHLWAPEDAPGDDALFMVVRGALMTLPVGAALVAAGHYVWAPVGLSGALMGGCYWVGYRHWCATGGHDGERILPTGAEMGEWLTGASVAACCASVWVAV